MVLTDDDFATIEAAVEEGRGVYDNLTKFITWTLPTNIGEGLVILVAIALGAYCPSCPPKSSGSIMTTAVALGLMLAFEPKEAGIMARARGNPASRCSNPGPRWPDRVGIRAARGRGMVALRVGIGQRAHIARKPARSAERFVVVQAFYLFSCRSLTHSAWRIGIFANRWLIAGVASQAIAQLAITYLPAMNAVSTPLPSTRCVAAHLRASPSWPASRSELKNGLRAR